MKRICGIKAIAATFVAAIAFSFGFASCQGRTMNNMEPSGDTVEVNVGTDVQTDTLPADTVPTSHA